MSIVYNGIDVSAWQGSIDWSRVKAAGNDFALIRLGWCGYDGQIVNNGGLDKTFESNVRGAIQAGLEVGVYVYSYATTAAAARVAAQETLGLVKPYTLRYPVVFDLEDAQYQSYSRASNTAIAEAFLSQVEAEGYYAMLYTFKSFAESHLNMQSLARYDFWLAQWAAASTYSGDFGIWQYSNTGRVDGISGDVDLNYAYRDYPAIIQAAGLNNLEPGQEGGGEGGNDNTDKERLAQLEEALQKIKEIVDSL